MWCGSVWLDVHDITIRLWIHHSGLDAVRLASLSLGGAFARGGFLHGAVGLGFGEFMSGDSLVQSEKGAAAHGEGPSMVTTKVVALFDLLESVV
jgi:hypothetical protein